MPILTQSQIPLIVAHVEATQLIRRGEAVVRSTVDFFGKRAVAQIDDQQVWNLHDSRVSQFLSRWGATRITGKVNLTTQRRLRAVLVDAVEAGRSYQETADAIGRVFSVARGSRALSIARTEIGRASSFGAISGYRQVGISKKEWLATDDDATRESHAAMDGQVRDMDEDFSSPDGGTTDYPGDFGDPAEDANCRCNVLPVVQKKWSFRIRRALLRAYQERLRAPYDRQLRRALIAGFDAQYAEVMTVFRSVAQTATGSQEAA